ncbi:MAG: hypothetical protein KAI17_25990, partial [Thiotrichaceae bacterium]|nr:hypothetical protein [Thiotrichaceae bacterium]
STKPNITKKDICDKLFNNDNGICKEGDPEWCAAVPMKQTQARNFREWLMNKIDKTPDNELAALLGHLAKQAMNIAREQENKT